LEFAKQIEAAGRAIMDFSALFMEFRGVCRLNDAIETEIAGVA